MSERSSVSISEVLGDNYYIDKLTSSDYSPAVGDTVTITLLVKDVFGDPANGQTRTVTCTGGSFVSVNGTSITASSSVKVTTGSGGTVTLGLSVSVVDNIVVSDGRCECVVSSLSTSITNLEKVFFTQLTPSAITSASTWTNVNNGKIRLHRVGNICIASGGFQLKAKYSSAGWKQIATLPIGYKSDDSVELRNGALSAGKIADRLQVNGYNVSIYCSTANTEITEYISFDLVWATSDDYPSQ